ncbi:hypothetical protein L7F22_012576 [Adiantum nelumboides]|nr:hypothetical protein [Adiantum nelumboides]
MVVAGEKARPCMAASCNQHEEEMKMGEVEVFQPNYERENVNGEGPSHEAWLPLIGADKHMGADVDAKACGGRWKRVGKGGFLPVGSSDCQTKKRGRVEDQ